MFWKTSFAQNDFKSVSFVKKKIEQKISGSFWTQELTLKEYHFQRRTKSY